MRFQQADQSPYNRRGVRLLCLFSWSLAGYKNEFLYLNRKDSIISYIRHHHVM